MLDKLRWDCDRELLMFQLTAAPPGPLPCTGRGIPVALPWWAVGFLWSIVMGG
jgi:hypothetical protein